MVENKVWTSAFKPMEERCAELKAHKSFVVGQRDGKGDDGKPKKVWFIKNRLRTNVLKMRTVVANVPPSMDWSSDEIAIVKNAIVKAAKEILITTVEAKKNGNFSRATFMARPKLTDAEKKARMDAKMAKKKEREARRAEKAKTITAHRAEVEARKKAREQKKVEAAKAVLKASGVKV